jgi:hypothetical protein
VPEIHPSHKMETERHPNHSNDYCGACGLWENDKRLAAPCGRAGHDDSQNRTES